MARVRLMSRPSLGLGGVALPARNAVQRHVSMLLYSIPMYNKKSCSLHGCRRASKFARSGAYRDNAYRRRPPHQGSPQASLAPPGAGTTATALHAWPRVHGAELANKVGVVGGGVAARG